MSTTTVCRGLQSCSEPQLVHPLTLRLTLAPPKSHSPQPEVAPLLSDSNSGNEEPKQKSNASTKQKTANGGWSFIESLAKEDKETPPYVHPLYKRASSTLSKKSLELCTEGLCNETGSVIGDESDLDLSSSSDSDSRRSPIRERSRLSQLIHKKTARRSFPPPLASISGSDYVQCTPHREGGRLVIKAIKIATSQTCFQAERSNGRLRLLFKTPGDTCSSSEEETDDDDEEHEHDHDHDHHDTCLNEKTNNGSCKQVEGEMAIVKYQRPCSWYKENGHEEKRLLNWKPFLGVAI